MSSSTSPPPSTPPSIELSCPISGNLMADPVMIPTGHTFERACVEACKELNFVPRILQTSLSEFRSFKLIPNSILKSLIIQWCNTIGSPHPLPISRENALRMVRNLKGFGLPSATLTPPPTEFLCPFSCSLMADPVIIPTGHTFERACIEACRELNFVPPILQIPLSDFQSFILMPNSILKSLILQWCSSTGSPHPLPISREDACSLVQNLKGSGLPPATPTARPPIEFICPFSFSLMADPVIIPTGQTFERAYIEACKEMNYVPQILQASLSDFLSFILIPNSILKSLILQWCYSTGSPHPLPVSREEARWHVQDLKITMLRIGDNQEPSPRISGRPKPTQSSPGSSKIKSEKVQMARFIQFAFPSGPPPYTSIQRRTSADHASIQTQILNLLQDSNIPSKRLALNTVVSQIMESSENKISYCNERIMAALVPELQSPNEDVQLDAAAVILGFTQEISNRRNIVRWEAVPGLVHVLNTGVSAARVNAAGAVCNLAIDGPEITMVLGLNDALAPLLEIFCSPLMFSLGRERAGLAADHLTCWAWNLSILEKMKAAPRLCAVATDKSCDRILRRLAIKIMCNLADGSGGKAELMDVDVVGAMSTMIREGEGMDAECMALMYRIGVFHRA